MRLLSKVFNIRVNYIIKRVYVSIGLAFSGGKDSVTLLSIYKYLVNDIVLVYINHNIRLVNKDNIIKVYKIAKRYRLKLLVIGINIDKIGYMYNGLEAYARLKRLSILNNIAIVKNIKFIIIAHHRYDLIECFFIRLFKVSGIEALVGIYNYFKIDKIIFIRPLLRYDLNIINRFMGERVIVIDGDNYNVKLLRNFIRLFIRKIIVNRFNGINYNVFKLIKGIRLRLRS